MGGGGGQAGRAGHGDVPKQTPRLLVCNLSHLGVPAILCIVRHLRAEVLAEAHTLCFHAQL